jgi:D-tyrosyl-tRNA(Tyr) deacylase
VLQRVTQASVTVGGDVTGVIGLGICALVGVANDDHDEDAEWLAEKVVGARLFVDAGDKMNLDLAQVGGAILAISQFTLLGDLRRGRRPSFSAAMEPVEAARLFERFCDACRARGVRVQTGRFRAHMEVEIHNSGPVTLLLDSRRTF